VIEKYLIVISVNIGTSAIIFSQDSDSKTILTKQNDKDYEETIGDNYYIVMTTLCQIVQNKHNLANIE